MLLKRKLFFVDNKLTSFHQELNQRNVAILLRKGIGIHSDMVDPTDLAILIVQRASNDLNVDSNSPVARNASRLVFQIVIERLGITDR